MALKRPVAPRLGLWRVTINLMIFTVYLFSSLIGQSAPAETPSAKTVFETVKNSLVEVKTAKSPDASSDGYGSGFAVGDGTLILTNFHVISEAMVSHHLYSVFVSTPKGWKKAELIDFSSANDIALLKIEDSELKPLSVREAEISQGEKIYSLGRPLDLGTSIVEGTYNGVLERGSSKTIQMSSPINPGMSGGPVVDGNGHLVGLNVSLLIGSQNVSFAVPISNYAKLKQDNPIEKNYFDRWNRVLTKQREELLELSRAAVKAITSQKLPYITLSKWKFRDSPKNIMTCSEGFDEPDGFANKVRVAKNYCYNMFGAHLVRTLNGGQYEIHRQVIEGLPGSKITEKLGIADDYYNNFQFFNHESPYVKDQVYVGQYDCDQGIVKNYQNTKFHISVCSRKLVRHPDFKDVDMRIESVDITKPIFTTHFRALGMNGDDVQKIISSLVNDVNYEDKPDLQPEMVVESQPTEKTKVEIK